MIALLIMLTPTELTQIVCLMLQLCQFNSFKSCFDSQIKTLEGDLLPQWLKKIRTLLSGSNPMPPAVASLCVAAAMARHQWTTKIAECVTIKKI